MQKALNIGFILIVALGLIQIYTFVHEGAHALMAWVFGGGVSTFDINVLGGNPHVTYTVFPLVLWFVFMIFLNKGKPLVLQKVALLLSFGIFGTLLPNVIIPLVYELGGDVRAEDMGKFLAHTGLNGFLVSGVMALVLLLAIMTFLRKVKFVEALKYQVSFSA